MIINYNNKIYSKRHCLPSYVFSLECDKYVMYVIMLHNYKIVLFLFRMLLAKYSIFVYVNYFQK